MEFVVICLGIVLIILAFGFIVDVIYPHFESFYKLKQNKKNMCKSLVYYELPDRSTIPCELFIETDETGTSMIVAKPIEK